MITSVDLRREMLDALPDYGLDEVLEEVGVVMPEAGTTDEFLVRTCGYVVGDALRNVDRTHPDRLIAFWQPEGFVWMVREDDRIAREALEAASTGADLLSAPDRFVMDVLATAVQLARYRRPELGYDDGPGSRDWEVANPLASQIVQRAPYVRLDPERARITVPALSRTAFRYIID